MSNEKNLGIFWEDNAFSVVESQLDVPQNIFKVPHQPLPESDLAIPNSNFDEIRFVGPLKAALQANDIKTTDVNLVLPSKDIIIRSFVIPFLKQSEIRPVVEFEIKKYIPFNVKDIVFNFHAVTFNEDKVKRMRVHFVAIRRVILDRYKSILKNAGLNVVYSEPVAMCIARVLIHKKIVKFDQRLGIVYPDFNDAGIIIIDKGVVQFVRDFQLQNPTLNIAPLDMPMLKKKLFNEIKISLDFYVRQFKCEKLGELVSLSFEPSQDLSAELQAEMEIPTKQVNLSSIARFPVSPDFGLLAAHGINIRGITKTTDFNLSGVVAASNQTAGLKKEKVLEEYIPIIKVAIVCAAVFAVVLVLANINTNNYKKKYDAIADAQGPFVDMKPDEIETRIAANRNKLNFLEKTYEPTQIAFFLAHIAKLLPTGMWLSEMDVKYLQDKESSGSIARVETASTSGGSDQIRFLNFDISGYVYAEDSNEQFKKVYAFVSQLKSDETFKDSTRAVNLLSIQSEQRGDEVVTSFKIRIK